MGVCQSSKNAAKENRRSSRSEESPYEFEEFMKLSMSNKKKGVLIKFKLFEIIDNKKIQLAKYLFIEYNGNVSSRVFAKSEQMDIVYFGKIDSF